MTTMSIVRVHCHFFELCSYSRRMMTMSCVHRCGFFSSVHQLPPQRWWPWAQLVVVIILLKVRCVAPRRQWWWTQLIIIVFFSCRLLPPPRRQWRWMCAHRQHLFLIFRCYFHQGDDDNECASSLSSLVFFPEVLFRDDDHKRQQWV